MCKHFFLFVFFGIEFFYPKKNISSNKMIGSGPEKTEKLKKKTWFDCYNQ